MIEKFAVIGGRVSSELLDLSHTSKRMILVSLMLPKLAPRPGDELRRASEAGY